LKYLPPALSSTLTYVLANAQPPPYTAGLDKPSTPSPPGWLGGRNYVEVVEYGERNIMKNVKYGDLFL